MSLYYRNLKRIGICMILVAVGNLIYELLIRSFLIETASRYAVYIPLPWGIWTKNLIGVTAGLTALLFYAIKRHYRLGTVILSLLCVAEAAVIVLSMTGSAGKRANGIVDITMLMMVLLTYTLSQTDRDLKRWSSVSTRPPAILDLRLADHEDFFEPLQLGPKMAINQNYAAVISRFITSMRHPAPLQINLFCASPVSPSMQDMMREVLEMHYQTEEDRIVKVLEDRYRRIMLLVSISVFVIGLVRQTSFFSDEMVVWEIIGNFAAFGLWQIGYTHYERNEAYEELLTVHIAKFAKLRFIKR